MNFREKLKREMDYLRHYEQTAISINTTAKNKQDFLLLPRRYAMNTAISNFLINDSNLVKETLAFFDGKVGTIFVDVEQKQNINLFKIAQTEVKKTKLATVKPNDTSIESCDLLIRNEFKDELPGKNAIIIGTGNLASKLAIRLAERQVNVYMKGRTQGKEDKVIAGINCFLPKYSPRIQPFDENREMEKADMITAFLSGWFTEEEVLYPYIDNRTFIVDGGINNFSREFVTKMLNQHTAVTRLDTRIALPYQFLSAFDYTADFFSEVYGCADMMDVPVASGGFIGSAGTVIVDNISKPTQIVGIADGSGGVKKFDELSESDSDRIQTIEQAISARD